MFIYLDSNFSSVRMGSAEEVVLAMAADERLSTWLIDLNEIYKDYSFCSNAIVYAIVCVRVEFFIVCW